MREVDDLNIRMLNANEFDREDLIELFHKHGSPVPNPLVASIQVAEDSNGEMVGFVVLQPQYHAEPIFIDKRYQNTLLHKELITKLLDPLAKMKGLRIFIFAPNGKIASLATRFDFKQLDYSVFMRES